MNNRARNYQRSKREDFLRNQLIEQQKDDEEHDKIRDFILIITWFSIPAVYFFLSVT